MLLGIVLLSISVFAAPLYAGENDAAASALAALLADTRNMQAEFSQRVASDQGELLEESAGKMAFQRPHQLRWEINEPYRYLVLTNGETLWRYDPDFEQLSTESFTSVAQTPMLILAASAASLSEQYQIGEVGDTFTLKPLAKQVEFTQLALSFKGRALTKMLLTDNLGQQTEIRLRNTQINIGTLADSLFVFEQSTVGHEQ
ncbi:MAG: outer membrane lipoprotein carrier protein [Bermanella sp.]|jgi:outer membrane lipoprotein carrier protein